jgi:hypothetical protein
MRGLVRSYVTFAITMAVSAGSCKTHELYITDANHNQFQPASVRVDFNTRYIGALHEIPHIQLAATTSTVVQLTIAK